MKAEKLWDRLAKNWDKPGVSLGENDIRLIRKAKQYYNSGSTVLDYGCATGSIVFEIAKEAKQVYGVDFSSRMIDTAKKKVVETKTGNADFIYGSIFNEGLKKEYFDVITAFSVLHLVPDLPQVFERINTLLKPGGVFISVSPCLGEKHFISLVINAGVYVLSKAGVLPVVNFFQAKALNEMITTARFRIIVSEHISQGSINEVFIAAQKMYSA